MDTKVLSNDFVVQWNSDDVDTFDGKFTAKLHTLGEADQYRNRIMAGTFPEKMLPLLKFNHGKIGKGGPIWGDTTMMGVTRMYENSGDLMADGEVDMENPEAVAYGRNLKKLGPHLPWSWTYIPQKGKPITLANGKRGLELSMAEAFDVSPVFKAGGVDSRTIMFNASDVSEGIEEFDIEALLAGDEELLSNLSSKVIDHYKDDNGVLDELLKRIQLHQKINRMLAKGEK